MDGRDYTKEELGICDSPKEFLKRSLNSYSLFEESVRNGTATLMPFVYLVKTKRGRYRLPGTDEAAEWEYPA